MSRLSRVVRDQFGPKGQEWEQKAFEQAKSIVQEKKLSALASHYGLTLSSGLIPIAPEKLKLLLLRLAEDHVRGFKVAVKKGAPKKASATENEFKIYFKVSTLMSERGLSVHRACQIIATELSRAAGRNGKALKAEGVRSIYRRVGSMLGQSGK